jgi:four helix bundle protein
MGNFKNLRVWQESINLAESIYLITRRNQFSKDWGLRDQIQRTTVSIASNIAEGEERLSPKENIYYLNVAKGSAAEVITQLHIANRIGYINQTDHLRLEDQTEKIRALIKNLINQKSNDYRKS